MTEPFDAAPVTLKDALDLAVLQFFTAQRNEQTERQRLRPHFRAGLSR